MGAAWIARRAVLPAIVASRNGTLVAIASREPERAGEFASEFGATRVSPSYESLLDDPDVHAVYIPLVNTLHREWTLRAIARGKHVLCEKPLAMNAHEAEEMAEAAARAKLHLMEAFMYRFEPRMRAFVAGMREPLHVQASFGFTVKDPHDIRLQPDLGGGALLDVGCYAVSVSRWILGEPDGLSAWARHDESRPAGVDLTVSALLHFPSGATAAVWASCESPEQQDLTVISRDGTQRLERPFTWREAADPYQLMVESFGDSILGGQEVAIPIRESIANMKALDRIRELIR